MANGDPITRKDRLFHVKMIDARAATDNGVWLSTDGYDQVTFHVDGITTATVTINASNAPTIPANSTAGVVRASLTADGEVIYDVLPRWMKCAITAWTTGTISVYAVFRLSGGVSLTSLQ